MQCLIVLVRFFFLLQESLLSLRGKREEGPNSALFRSFTPPLTHTAYSP